jgi:diguanylate cyclase (GGDEF)-like protein
MNPSTALRFRSSLATHVRWYALSVVLSAAALSLMVLFRPLMEHSSFFLFLAAVSVSAIYGGLGPGLVATVLSTTACGLYFLPPDGVPLGRTEDVLKLTIFLSTGVIISWLAESRKRADDRLHRRNKDLERWVAQREELVKQLEYRATHDHLTDLHNQASFYEHLSRALARARRRGSKVAVLFVDLDDFKLVNDALGHQEADGVLRAVAEHLKGCLRESEIAARIGGDEFVVVLEDVTDTGTAVRVAERVQQRLRTPFRIHDRHRMRLSASIGIAVGARGRPRELLRAADLAVYQAKRMGKGQNAVFDPNVAKGHSI